MLPALSHLCLSGDRERQIHAVAAMANIAEMVEGRTQKRMIEEGCIKPLLGLVDSPDVSGALADWNCFPIAGRLFHSSWVDGGGKSRAGIGTNVAPFYASYIFWGGRRLGVLVCSVSNCGAFSSAACFGDAPTMDQP